MTDAGRRPQGLPNRVGRNPVDNEPIRRRFHQIVLLVHLQTRAGTVSDVRNAAYEIVCGGAAVFRHRPVG